MASVLSVTEVPTLADFGNDPFWLTLVKVVFVFGFLVVMTLFMIVWERKAVARMQQRKGPDRTGPQGALQSLADGFKLALKEEIIPALADRPVYVLAPILSAVPAFMAFSVIPLSGTVSFFGERTPLQLTDLPVGILFVLAMASVGVYGLVLSGWASGSTYPLLGSLRSAAQVISYELSLGLALVAVFLFSGSLSTSEIVASQTQPLFPSLPSWLLWTQLDTVPFWHVVLLPSFVIYAISAVGETNRAPFDLPEAESELVGGFHTEYTSLKFAMFFLAEYINMVTVSAVAVTLFLGGWLPPWPLSTIDFFATGLGGYIGLVWFTSKLLAVLFVFIWLRGTLPRLRYDQFMRFGWKFLIPAALVWTMAAAGVRLLQEEGAGLVSRLVVVVGVVAAGYAVYALLTRSDDDDEPTDEDVREAAVGLRGYPVPDLPVAGQLVFRGPRAEAVRAPDGGLPGAVAVGAGPARRGSGRSVRGARAAASSVAVAPGLRPPPAADEVPDPAADRTAQED